MLSGTQTFPITISGRPSSSLSRHRTDKMDDSKADDNAMKDTQSAFFYGKHHENN